MNDDFIKSVIKETVHDFAEELKKQGDLSKNEVNCCTNSFLVGIVAGIELAIKYKITGLVYNFKGDDKNV